ncbi:MAG: hypothetical protein IJV26_02240 [Lachnospiraceae bacterium]|nr:hypothetical protein [Lachnospiraceae bacterium]
MIRNLFTAALIITGALILSACASVTDGGTAQENRGTTPLGTWYEQRDYGGTMQIDAETITYTTSGGNYSFQIGYTYQKTGKEAPLVTDDYFYFEDISYDPSQDLIIAYTMSHTDGDGGHNRVEFRRAPYSPPPAPVYPPAVDQSDPDAQKEFADLTIRSMKVSFYDEGEPFDTSSNMARPLPYPDHYSYELEVLEDGSGRVSSSYCQEIELTKEQVEALQVLAQEADLGQINGIDIHTEGVPDDSPDYTAEIELMSGETIRSSANWTAVPENWMRFQTPMHRLLFTAFEEAGYNGRSGEFHSTKAMRRVQGEETLYRENTGIVKESVTITENRGKSYDYTLDTKYFVFSDPENRYPALMKTLNELSRQYKETAEATLKKHYRVMEEVPKSVWKKKDRRYCYSLYAVDQWSLSRNIFSFTVSTGEVNSLGAGDFGYGRYRNVRYNIDVETGRILSVGDLFTDPDALYDVLMEVFSHYGTHNEYGKFVHSEAFPEILRAAIAAPEPEGIGFNYTYDYLELWMPLGLYEGNDSQAREVLYYDDIQDILGEKYTSVW